MTIISIIISKIGTSTTTTTSSSSMRRGRHGAGREGGREGAE